MSFVFVTTMLRATVAFFVVMSVEVVLAVSGVVVFPYVVPCGVVSVLLWFGCTSWGTTEVGYHDA